MGRAEGRVQGKVALISGGARNIGGATARMLVAEGASVVIGDVLDEEGQALADELNATRAGAATYVHLDVTDDDQWRAAVAATTSTYGSLTVLFNNAGVSALGATIDAVPVADWRRCIDINVTGSFICARATFARMKAQEPQGGRIINNGSVSAYVPRWGSAPYTASKHAITGLTRSISLDGRPYNIACGQIDVGNALTEMAEKMTRGVPQADGEIAVEPVMDVAHVAESVLHMAGLPLAANVQFMTVMASGMPYIGRG